MTSKILVKSENRVICVCGCRTHLYNPRVGKHRSARVCEHKKPDGTKCPLSKVLVDYTENGNAIREE